MNEFWQRLATLTVEPEQSIRPRPLGRFEAEQGADQRSGQLLATDSTLGRSDGATSALPDLLPVEPRLRHDGGPASSTDRDRTAERASQHASQNDRMSEIRASTPSPTIQAPDRVDPMDGSPIKRTEEEPHQAISLRGGIDQTDGEPELGPTDRLSPNRLSTPMTDLTKQAAAPVTDSTFDDSLNLHPLAQTRDDSELSSTAVKPASGPSTRLPATTEQAILPVHDLSIRPASVASTATLERQQVTAAEATVIEISIGRIELRPAVPVAMAPRSRPRFEPQVSLAAYLRQRNGGGE